MYSIRNCGSDRKPWLIEREGYHHAVGAFYTREDAERYLARILAYQPIKPGESHE